MAVAKWRGYFFILLSSAAYSYDIKDFVKQPQYEDFVLSPSGDYLAIIAKIDDGDSATRDKTELRIVDLKKNEIISKLSFRSGHSRMGMKDADSVLDVAWGKNERLIVRAGIKMGRWEQEWRDPDVLAVNIDGSKRVTIFGPSAGREDLSRGAPSKTSQAQGEYASMVVKDYLPENPEEVLIAKYPWTSGTDGESKPSILRLNIFTGKQTSIETIPVTNSGLLLDQTNLPRFAERVTTDHVQELYYRESAETEFKKIFSGKPAAGVWSPITFFNDNQTVLIASNIESSISGLYSLNLKTGVKEAIYQSSTVDVEEGHVIWSGDGKSVIGFRSYDGLPKLHLLPGNEPEKIVYKLASQALPGKRIGVRSFSLDGTKAFVSASSDTDPGSYYYVDVQNKKITKYADRLPWMKGRTLSVMQPKVIKARDGVILHSYLTVPANKEPTKLPTVLLVHGGPFGVRDYWGYNEEVQMLASNGYAVLQVNYRGSGGYGREFEYGAYRKWGTTMQDDLVDATRWLVDQGIADAKRICIMGHSYGGYASVWGVARDPDLYQCAVGSMGVYDMTLKHEIGDVQESAYGRHDIMEKIGDNEEELKSISPVNFAHKIKASVLLAHGQEDKRVPIEHAERMKAALKKAHKPFELIEFSGESHGFANEKNREDFYTKVMAFLDKNIGH